MRQCAVADNIHPHRCAPDRRAGSPSLEYQMDKWFADPSSGYPIIHCLVHDELHYYPAERELAEALNPPFVIRLKADGSVASGRYAITRGHDIAHVCAFPRRQP